MNTHEVIFAFCIRKVNVHNPSLTVSIWLHNNDGVSFLFGCVSWVFRRSFVSSDLPLTFILIRLFC